MAPHRHGNNGVASKPRRKRRMPPPGTEEYKEKRERNNVAVRKSREKTRSQAKQTTDRVSSLREENRMLEQQVEILSKELTILRDLFNVVQENQDGHSDLSNTSVQTDGVSNNNLGVLEASGFLQLEAIAPGSGDSASLG